MHRRLAPGGMEGVGYRYRVVLWDLDGTLLNTLPFIYGLIGECLEEAGHAPATTAEIGAMLGPPEEEVLTERLGHQFADRFTVRYREYLEMQGPALVPDPLLSLLEKLQGHGIKMGIITNKSRRLAQASVQAAGLQRFFDPVVSGGLGVGLKPHPDGIRYALRYLHEEPAGTLMIGDQAADLAAAAAAQVHAVHARWFADPRGMAHQCASDCEHMTRLEDRLVVSPPSRRREVGP